MDRAIEERATAKQEGAVVQRPEEDFRQRPPGIFPGDRQSRGAGHRYYRRNHRLSRHSTYPKTS